MIHECTVKVRAFETDGLGHVSNISYFIYLEEARIELFRELGASLEMGEWEFILASTSCDFKQQAYFDEKLTVETSVEKIGNSSFHLYHEVVNDRGIIATGKAAIVHFDFHTQRASALPIEMRAKLEQFMETTKVKER
ncbi:acyl-CoA thioester hydrolase [Salirhabdus euzebyi]|uniref:Acyl-CoA thioester hydrolase n=1 Tax=Salirhabdus euzebyi TaxID=394506 RepID=A0A841Q4B7_9BACI|nr:thioesterase family protein [Salirhabdus euzebyi]MBB6453261.1 acyl-CoA thioester hydrolase [Salirhabdus euzebyi]